MRRYTSTELPSPVFPEDEARNAEFARWAEEEAREKRGHLLQPQVTAAHYEPDLLQYQRALRAAEANRRKGFDLRVDVRMTPEQAQRIKTESAQGDVRRKIERERATYENLTPDGPVSDAFGKIPALPATTAGAVAGSLNVLASRLAGIKDARITLGNNAIQFENGLLGVENGQSAFTLGNSVLYGPDTHPDTAIKDRYDGKGLMHATFADHEKAHTYRYANPFFAARYLGSKIVDAINRDPHRYEVEADDFAEEAARRRK